MKIFKIFILLLFPFFTFSQNLEKNSSSSYYIEKSKNGGFNEIVKNSRYIPFYKNGQSYIIHEDLETSSDWGSEQPSGFVKAIAYLADKNNSILQKTWSLNTNAHNSLINDDFYITYYEGCCGGEKTYSYHSLSNGKNIFNATSDIRIYNSPIEDIFVSYQAISSSRDFPRQIYTDDLCGVITIALKEKSVVKIALLSDEAYGEYSHTPDIFFLLDPENKRRNKIHASKSIYSLNDVDTLTIFLDFYGAEITLIFNKGKYNNTKSTTHPNFGIKMSSINDHYLFQDRYFSLDKKSKIELMYLRNEIFARHGHSFNRIDLKSFFNQKNWY